MMKKTFLLLISLAMLAITVGCSGNSGDPSSDKAAGNTAASETSAKPAGAGGSGQVGKMPAPATAPK